MDPFIQLLEGEKVLLELGYRAGLPGWGFQEKAYLTNKRIIEHEAFRLCCYKDQKVYCTYLSDVLSLSYSDNPFLCCCWRHKTIYFKTSLSARHIRLVGHEDMDDIVASFTKAIEKAHKEQ